MTPQGSASTELLSDPERNRNAGEILSVKRLERVRSDDPRVRILPAADIEKRFRPQDASDEELQAVWQRSLSDGIAEGLKVAEATVAANRPKPKPLPPALQPIPLEHAVIALKHIGPLGASVRMASLDEDGEPVAIAKFGVGDDRWRLVKRNRGFFRKALPVGVAIEDAVICIATEPIIRHGSDGASVEREILPGECVHKDDPIVAPVKEHFRSATQLVAGGSDQEGFRVVARPDQIQSDSGIRIYAREFATD